MEINQQIFRAPSIPKIGKRTISSSVIRGAVKPQIKLNRSVFSFIKPVQRTIDADKISVDPKESLGGSADKQLAETNRILVEIQKQLALDFGYRIAEEKKALAAEKKRISAQKVADKESKLEQGARGILGKTFDKVVAPFKSIFQKLIDFFSIILTGILLNTAFKWLGNPENRKKLAEFFGFLKEYWQELLIIFGIAKLAKLVAKIFSIASKIKKLLSFWPKKPPTGTGKDPCKCPKPGTPDFCKNILNCFDNDKLEKLASALLKTKAFAAVFGAGVASRAQQYDQKKKEQEQKKARELQQAVEEGKKKVTPASYGPIIAEARRKALETNRSVSVSTPDGGRVFVDRFGNPTVKNANEVQQGEQQSQNLLFALLGTSLPALFGRRGRTSTKPSTVPQQGTYPGVRPPSTRLTPESLVRPTTDPSKVRLTQPTTRPTVRNPIPKKFVQKGTNKLTTLQKKLLDEYDRSEIADIAYGKTKTDSETTKAALDLIDRFLSGSLIKKSKGGTIGGRGPGNVDTIPALLAAGEEVIRTSSAMLFRPLLKDINDNAGRLWQAFSGATTRQNVNNMIQSDLNKKFNELIKQFKELIDGEVKRKRTANRGGGISRGGGSSIPTGSLSSSNTAPVNVSNTQINPTQNIGFVNNQGPQVNPMSVGVNMNNMVLGGTKIAVIPIPVKNLQRSRQQPKVNVINLPPKTVNLGPKPGSVKTPSSGSATEVPSISPFDASNPYISSNRLAYGMIM